MEIFSTRLKQLRVEHDIKQADLAKSLGVSPQSYSAYENGREPNFELLCKIADYFDTSLEYLLGKTNYRKTEHDIIGEKTGLADEAVAKLIGYALKEKEVLSCLLSNDSFISYLKDVNECIENTINTNFLYECIPSVTKDNKLDHNYIQRLADAVRNIFGHEKDEIEYSMNENIEHATDEVIYRKVKENGFASNIDSSTIVKDKIKVRTERIKNEEAILLAMASEFERIEHLKN